MLSFQGRKGKKKKKFIFTVIPGSERCYFILGNMYFADVMSILLKISLFGNALCDAFISFPMLSVCLEGLGVSQYFERLITGFLATLILKILARYLWSCWRWARTKTQELKPS